MNTELRAVADNIIDAAIKAVLPDEAVKRTLNDTKFDGKSEVEENELVNTTVHSQYKAEDGKVHEQERDIAKYWKRGCTDIVLYGIENQTKVEKRMPARISGYEGASYRGQCDKKTIVPVITMVLYYGTDRKWTAPKNLKSLIKVPDKLDEDL